MKYSKSIKNSFYDYIKSEQDLGDIGSVGFEDRFETFNKMQRKFRVACFAAGISPDIAFNQLLTESVNPTKKEWNEFDNYVYYVLLFVLAWAIFFGYVSYALQFDIAPEGFYKNRP